MQGWMGRVMGGLLAFTVLLPTFDVAAQNRGIQLSLDGTRVLVNKDVGLDRWAITLNTLAQTIVGNVFPSEGGDPIFVFCELAGGANTWACEAAGPCTTTTCVGQYAPIGVVTLPADFFAPPGFDPTAAAARDGMATIAAATNGFQVTPDGDHVLVSKDIGGERWAITLNRSDRTVTGNVFFAGGGDPAFVSCAQVLGNVSAYRCSGAGPCVTEGCTDQYDLIGTVTLPDDFFGPQTCGNNRLESNERCEAGGFCSYTCGVDVLCQTNVVPLPFPGVCSDDCRSCFGIGGF
jgi:hypothetical protein